MCVPYEIKIVVTFPFLTVSVISNCITALMNAIPSLCEAYAIKIMKIRPAYVFNPWGKMCFTNSLTRHADS